jgi:hypothetical protein
MTRLRVSFSELIILEMILRCVYRHRIRLKYFYAGTCESAAFFQQAPYIAGFQRRELKRERGLFRLAAAKDGNGRERAMAAVRVNKGESFSEALTHRKQLRLANLVLRQMIAHGPTLGAPR